MKTQQSQRIFYFVIIIATLLIGAGLILNISFHKVPWSNERDGYFLIGSMAEKEFINHLSVGYPVMLKITSLISGSAFRAGHFLSALFAFLVIIQSYRINLRLFDSQKVSAAASLSLFLFPAFIQSAIFCNSYMAFSFILLTFLLSITKSEESRGRISSYVDGSLLGLAYLVKILGLLYAVAFFSAVIVFKGLRKSTLSELIKTIAGFIITFASLGFLARTVFGWTGENVVGLRVHDPFEFIRAILFDALQVGQFKIDAASISQGLTDHAGEIIFRLLANPIERMMVALYFFGIAPLLAFIIMTVKTSNLNSKEHFKLIGISLLFYALMLFHISPPFNEVVRARFFLPFAPMIFGAFYYACFQYDKISGRRLRAIAGITVSLTIIFVLVSFAVTSARVFARDAKYYDYETEGLRPQLSRTQLEEAAAYFRNNFDKNSPFGTNNIAFGLVDASVLPYDLFHTYGTAPDFGAATKDSVYYQDNLANWLLHHQVPYFLYDSTDQFLVIRWEEYFQENAFPPKRFSPRYFEPVEKIGVIQIYSVLLDKCTDPSGPDKHPQPYSDSIPHPPQSVPPPAPGELDSPLIPAPPPPGNDELY